MRKRKKIIFHLRNSNPTAMPLIIFTGLPSSGKTRWANELREFLQGRIDRAKKDKEPGFDYTITYISDETLGIDHDSYRESATEKHVRGNQMSAVRRDLTAKTIVILDSLAYIKGFRYQLYCEAKGLQTPHCVIHVATSLEKSLEWNNNKTSNHKWDEEVIKQLDMRYEEPNDNTRWDSPLYTIVSDYEKEKLPSDDIWNSIVLKKAAPPNAATVIKATSGNSFLQELDKQTQEVISQILQHQEISAPGSDVIVDRENNLIVEMPPTAVSVPKLQRVRRTFISLNRMRNVDIERIKPLFVDYINGSLNIDD